jgi:hypothetical protein
MHIIETTITSSMARSTIRFAINSRWLTLALLTAFTSCVQSFKHDEVLAAKRALEFAQVVFLDKDLDKGYGLLAPGAKRHIPLDKFKQTITAMHPRSYPDQVTAVEYEPMAGEQAIYIFLTGRNGEAQFNYRVTMEGTADTDYKVLKIDQGGGFPTLSNQKQTFKPAISIP